MLLTNLASIMVGVSFYVVSLVLPQLLQLPTSTGYGLGQSMVVAGLCVAPLGLTMMFTAPVYARLSAKYGPKITLILGLLIIAIGYGAGLGLMSAAWQTVVIAVVLGAGIGLAYSSLPALIIGAVDPSETGAANGLNTLMRSDRYVGVERRHRHGAGEHREPCRRGRDPHDARLPRLLPDRQPGAVAVGAAVRTAAAAQSKGRAPRVEAGRKRRVGCG